MGSIVSATETLPDLPDLVPDPDDGSWNRPLLRDGWQ